MDAGLRWPGSSFTAFSIILPECWIRGGQLGLDLVPMWDADSTGLTSYAMVPAPKVTILGIVSAHCVPQDTQPRACSSVSVKQLSAPLPTAPTATLLLPISVDLISLSCLSVPFYLELVAQAMKKATGVCQGRFSCHHKSWGR